MAQKIENSKISESGRHVTIKAYDGQSVIIERHPGMVEMAALQAKFSPTVVQNAKPAKPSAVRTSALRRTAG